MTTLSEVSIGTKVNLEGVTLVRVDVGSVDNSVFAMASGKIWGVMLEVDREEVLKHHSIEVFEYYSKTLIGKVINFENRADAEVTILS